MKLITFNVNGIRSAMSKGLVQWLDEQQYDIVCMQETKARLEQIDATHFNNLGYNIYWHSAQKAGYSGVATFTKIKPVDVQIGMGIERFDSEGRVLITYFGDWALLNCYFPSGTSGEERQNVKYDFLDEFFNWINEFKKTHPNIIVVGDYNIAHNNIDIHDPKGNKKSSGFLPEERAWMDKWFESGFVDAFRHINPEKQTYTWWTFRFNARKNNKGWRIDYASVTDSLAAKIKGSDNLNDAVFSDHCPVSIDIDL